MGRFYFALSLYGLRVEEPRTRTHRELSKERSENPKKTKLKKIKNWNSWAVAPETDICGH